jgi:hypothetical protein
VIEASQAASTDGNYAAAQTSQTVEITAATASKPTITATITAGRPSRYGWYPTAVTVTFRCAATGAPLAESCPGPVTLSRNAAHQSATGSISATDGGTATAAVTDINIDQTHPRVSVASLPKSRTVTGKVPAGRCVASDSISGIASCKLTRKITHAAAGHRATVVYTATATSRAGISSTVHVTVKLH